MKKIILILTGLLTLAACHQLPTELEDAQLDGLKAGDILAHLRGTTDDRIKAVDLEFAPDYKTFTLTANMLQDIGPYNLQDTSQVRTQVEETLDGIRTAHITTPRLVKIQNIESACINQHDIRMLVLVDLSLPQSDLNAIRSAVSEMKTIFNHGTLFVAFMDSTSVSPTMNATDYVLENYFVQSRYNEVFLYRAMLQKRDEMDQGKGLWEDAKSRIMLVFSNEKVYRDDSDHPIDPNHYALQERMATLDADTSLSQAIYYISMRHDSNDEDEESSLLRLFCANNGGDFLHDFQWASFKSTMLKHMDLDFPDYKFYFENPDYKVYRNDNKNLTLRFYNVANDSLLATLSTSVVAGDPLNPIIVHGHHIIYVVIQGLFLAAILMALVYLVMQLLVPWVRYRLFLRKYVVPYAGNNMMVDDKSVEQCCYLCKAPFEVGEPIVVKCEHTMHKSCWDENGGHCPEYSDRCKEGSHHYNLANPFDPENASYYMKWLLVAIVASMLAWLCFTLMSGVQPSLSSHRSSLSMLTSFQWPFLGLAQGFFLTLGFSFLAIRSDHNPGAIGRMLMNCILASIGCWMSFMLVNTFIYLFGLSHITSLLNWIPWTASGFIIAYCTTRRTPLSRENRNGQRRTRTLILIIGVAIGLLSMWVWNLLFCYMELDFRALLLLSFIFFGASIAACIATLSPRSERYFLKVQGAMKGMDIALYKWFRNNTDGVVTLGKSVDCSLQLSWDIQSNIAPMQAEIRMEKGLPYLVALEPGVMLNGRPVPVDKRIRLYHGRSFTIGQTTFTYWES